MPGLFCCILIGLDSILREVGAGAQKTNRAIKRFRNRAISNRDFISINHTALLGIIQSILFITPLVDRNCGIAHIYFSAVK